MLLSTLFFTLGLRRPLYPAGNPEKQELKAPVSLSDFGLLAQDSDRMPGTVVGIGCEAKRRSGEPRLSRSYRTNRGT